MSPTTSRAAVYYVGAPVAAGSLKRCTCRARKCSTRPGGLGLLEEEIGASRICGLYSDSRHRVPRFGDTLKAYISVSRARNLCNSSTQQLGKPRGSKLPRKRPYAQLGSVELHDSCCGLCAARRKARWSLLPGWHELESREGERERPKVP